MSTRIEYQGRMYDDQTDFLAELREATRYGATGPSWLRSDIPLPWALSDWAEALKGTPLETKIADAALTLIETGTAEQGEAASGLPIELAPSAVDRVRAILERDPKQLGSGARSVPGVLWRLLQREPKNLRLLDLLRREADKPGADDWTKELASEYRVGHSP
jgi:hypothetical protein